jgi:glycerol-3-phosphate dehydrogenase
MRQQDTDLLILGGGIVGAGVARDAAMRGVSVILLEKHTFGFGTSSRSSRLIHGGIRYLELGDISLVYEALHERTTLLKIAPSLVRQQPFLFVLERGAWWQWIRVGIGVMLYRLLAGFGKMGEHHPLTRRRIARREPLLEGAPIVGGAIYQDAHGDDIGLVWATIESARSHGADVREGIDASIVVDEAGVVATLPNGETIRAESLVLALGPWTDRVRGEIRLPDRNLVGGTKGVHVTFPLKRLPLRHAVALRHPDDKRVMFCVPEPELDRVLVGTTDTETDEPPEALTVGEEDVEYLVRAVQWLFPKQRLGTADIVDRWAGVRPLLQQQGSESNRSREHSIIREGCVLTVAGGKLTTSREMAEDTVDLLAEVLGRELPECRTAEEGLV